MMDFKNVRPPSEKFLALPEFEARQFGARPTELRHLIGRLRSARLGARQYGGNDELEIAKARRLAADAAGSGVA